MWADSHWIFCDDREILKYMVNDTIEELMILSMDLKLESLWWTSTYEAEDGLTLEVGGGGKTGRCLSSRCVACWSIESKGLE